MIFRVQFVGKTTMSKTYLILFSIIFLLVYPYLYIAYKLYHAFPDVPVINETWWSHENPADEDRNIYPFKINVSQEVSST